MHIKCADGTEINKSVPLGRFASVFQAEIYAIIACAEMAEHLTSTGEMVIYSDSQAALKALGRDETTSAIVKECKEALKRLAERADLTLAWVPGHEGNMGNEQADELARKGAEESLVGPEPRLPIAHNITKGVISHSITAETNRRWRSSTGMRQSKIFIKGMDKKKTSKLMGLSRENMRLVIEIITGHCRLNRHLTVIGVKTDPICPECTESEETSLHLLAECPMYSLIRWELWGSDTLDIEDLKNLKVEQIARFTRETKRFDGAP